MDALNAAPDRDPFAFELQGELWHSRSACTPKPASGAIMKSHNAAKKLQKMVNFLVVSPSVTPLGY